ncbi:MAG: molecular chaperone DnaJ [Deltaproteobacteria bacterium]|nr:molecular chaperone DnaJ [Deltaproteobacteria bacterium]
MSQRRDYYEVLGVPRDAELKTIKAAYRKLAMQFHPDRNPGDKAAEDRFKEAAEAYEVLSDDDKRRLYDRGGHEALRGGGFSGFHGDVGDIFSQFGDIFAEFFGGSQGGFGFGAGGRRRPTAGADLRYDLELSLEEAFTGLTKEVEIGHTEACRDCGGSGAKNGELVTCQVCRGRGQVVSGRGGFMIATTCRACAGAGATPKSPCDGCAGRGRIERKKKLDVRIPAGVDNGVRLRLQGEGDAGDRGGPPGDLYVFLSVKGHEVFVRRGDDLLCEVSVSFPTACLGGQVTINGVNGQPVTIDIPPGMQPNDTVRVAGLGMPRLGDRGAGDVIVLLNISVPRKLNGEQKAVLEKLSEAFDEKSAVHAPGARSHETKKRKDRGIFDRLREALDPD